MIHVHTLVVILSETATFLTGGLAGVSITTTYYKSKIERLKEKTGNGS